MLITDNDEIHRIFAGIYQFVDRWTYTRLMKTSRVTRWPKGRSIVWIDLPRGDTMRGTKLDILGDSLLSRIDNAKIQQTPVFLLAPHSIQVYDTLRKSNHRWTKILARWRPHTAQVCSCRFTNDTKHHQYRIFHTGTQLRDAMCLQARSRAASREMDLTMQKPFLTALCQWIGTGKATVSLTVERPIHSQAYPTDSRERQREAQKADKEKGIERVVKKKIKHVEDHFDDCGEDLNSLFKGHKLGMEDEPGQSTPPGTDHALDYLVDEQMMFLIHSSDDELDDGEPSDVKRDFMEGITLFMFFGGEFPMKPLANLHKVYLASPVYMQRTLEARGQGIDIAEICGGQARTTQVAVRRKLKVGPNFDLVTDCDLTCPRQQSYAYEYFEKGHVLVAVMAPVCGPYGPRGHLTKYMYPDTWRQREAEVRPIAEFCGQIALR